MVSALFASNARGAGSISGWGIGYHAAWHDPSQKKKKVAEVLNRVGVHLRGGWEGRGGTDLAAPPANSHISVPLPPPPSSTPPSRENCRHTTPASPCQSPVIRTSSLVSTGRESGRGWEPKQCIGRWSGAGHIGPRWGWGGKGRGEKSDPGMGISQTRRRVRKMTATW